MTDVTRSTDGLIDPATHTPRPPGCGRGDIGIPVSVMRALSIVAPVMFVLLSALSMGKQLDHDEHQFVASGALLARQGLLPYRDYPYFHLPNQVFVFAALDRISSRLLLSARLFNVTCSTCTLSVLLVLGLRWFACFGARTSRYAAAALVVGVMFNPVYAYTSGKAWNHDLPVLLTLLALLSIWRWRTANGGAAVAWIAACGALFGLAVGTRLTFAPCGAAFIGSIFFTSLKTRRQKLAALGCFSIAALLALAPTFWFIAATPRQFWFGNFRYPELNTEFRRHEHYERSMTALGKIAYLFKDVLIRPGNLLLAIAAGASLVAMRQKPGDLPHPRRFEMLSLAMLIGTLLIGTFAPTPLWWPYFFAPVPFLGLFVACVAADERKTAAEAAGWWKALAVFALITFVAGVGKYREMAPPTNPTRWIPERIHAQGVEIASRTAGGRVLTLAPLIPMEGGCAIYEPFATGPFALRIAGMIREEDELLFKEVDDEDLGEMIQGRPPAGALLGFENALERPLRLWVERHTFAHVPLKTPGDPAVKAAELWIASSASTRPTEADSGTHARARHHTGERAH